MPTPTPSTPGTSTSPAGNPNAITVRQQETQMAAAGQDVKVLSIASRSDVERIETVVSIPADYQYEIKRKVKDSQGNWSEEAKVGLTADAYDYLNRVIGVTFFMPEFVHDAQDQVHRNPIHRKDYIYLRLTGVWYNPLGQLLSNTEDVEVDFNLTWMDARINAYGATVVVDDRTGMPLFDDFGNPMVRIDPKEELKALKTLSQLRTFGPRYAQTVARVRLLKMASGIRSLPIPHVKDFQIRVVGYRDRMTPQERVARVGGDTSTLYGRPADIKPLSGAELSTLGAEVDPDTEAIDREAVAAHQRDPEPTGPASRQAQRGFPPDAHQQDIREAARDAGVSVDDIPGVQRGRQVWTAEDIAGLDSEANAE